MITIGIIYLVIGFIYALVGEYNHKFERKNQDDFSKEDKLTVTILFWPIVSMYVTWLLILKGLMRFAEYLRYRQ